MIDFSEKRSTEVKCKTWDRSEIKRTLIRRVLVVEKRRHNIEERTNTVWIRSHTFRRKLGSDCHFYWSYRCACELVGTIAIRVQRGIIRTVSCEELKLRDDHLTCGFYNSVVTCTFEDEGEGGRIRDSEWTARIDDYKNSIYELFNDDFRHGITVHIQKGKIR